MIVNEEFFTKWAEKSGWVKLRERNGFHDYLTSYGTAITFSFDKEEKLLTGFYYNDRGFGIDIKDKE